MRTAGRYKKRGLRKEGKKSIKIELRNVMKDTDAEKIKRNKNAGLARRNKNIERREKRKWK